MKKIGPHFYWKKEERKRGSKNLESIITWGLGIISKRKGERKKERERERGGENQALEQFLSPRGLNKFKMD